MTTAHRMILARAASAAFSTITDSFNRADGSLGNTDTGQAWQVLSGPWQIVGNQATVVSNGNNQHHAVVESNVSDCTVKAKMIFSSDGGPAFRCSDDNNLYVLSAQGNTLYRRVAGSYTVLSSLGGVNPGDDIKAVLSGNSITIWVAASQRVTVTDSFNSTATKHGLREYDAASFFDDFSVTVP